MTNSRTKIFFLTIITSFLLPTFSLKAAVINYDVEVNIDSGLLDGNNYTGTLSYDDTGLTGIGSESQLISNFNFLFEGVTYTENDDPSANVEFLDGDFLGLNYSGDAPAFPSFVSALPPFFDASFSYDLGGLGGAGTGVLIYTPTSETTPVPESSSLLGLLLIIGVGAFAKTKAKKQ